MFFRLVGFCNNEFEDILLLRSTILYYTVFHLHNSNQEYHDVVSMQTNGMAILFFVIMPSNFIK